MTGVVVIGSPPGTVVGMSPEKDTPTNAALADSVAGLLGMFGVASSSAYDRVAKAVTDECARLGVPATVVELRWGRLWLSCPPQTAGLLRAHCDALLVVAESAAPGTVSRVGVRPARTL